MITLCVYIPTDIEEGVMVDVIEGGSTDMRIMLMREKKGYGAGGEHVERKPGYVKFSDTNAPRCVPYELVTPHISGDFVDDVRTALVADRLTGHTP